MWIKRVLLGCLLVFSLSYLYSQEVESVEPSITTEDIQTLKQVFQSILSYTDLSTTDLTKLNSLFNNWENEIKQLPMQQERASNLLKENLKLQTKNKILTISLIGIGTITLIETGYIIGDKILNWW